MLGRCRHPGVEFAHRLWTQPVLIFDLCRRIDHAGYVAGPRQNVADVAAKIFCAGEHRSGRGDMVLACREIVDGDHDFVQIQRDAADHHRAFGKLVLQIAIAQVKRMVGLRHAGRIGIPCQQIKRAGLDAFDVIIDDIGPNQVIGAQHVEGIGHFCAIEIAGLLHLDFGGANLLFIHKHFQVARIGEIDLCGEQCGA